MDSNRSTRLLQSFVKSSHVLTVAPTSDSRSADFTSISAAMDAIPLTPPDHPFVERWTIFVMAGYYEEEIRMKPHVSIVGIDKDSVYIQAPPVRPRDRHDPRRATVYLNYFTSISNVILANRGDSEETDYVVWNKNMYPQVRKPSPPPLNTALDVSFIGMTNVDIMPFGPYPDSPDGVDSHGLGKAILLEGNWHTAIMTHVLSGYLGQRGYLINIRGVGQNADCHFIDCFFDGLYINSEVGGCVLVENCSEVHIRSSLIRVAAGGIAVGLPNNQRAPGAAVATFPGDDPQKAAVATFPGDDPQKTRVTLEGTSLQAPWPGGSYRVLDVAPDTRCDFFHSSTDSVRGRRFVFPGGLPDNDTIPVITI